MFVPASDEHVAKCVSEFDAMIKNSPMVNAMPRVSYKQAVEEGGWLPKKGPAYPITSPMEAYVKERHLAYIAHCFDARTGDKLPTFVEEEVYNAEFDRLMIKKKKHPHWRVLQEL